LLIENQGDADIDPDGKGFVMLQRATTEEGVVESGQVILVTNWFEELERMILRDSWTVRSGFSYRHGLF
jgi:hypothetical protein